MGQVVVQQVAGQTSGEGGILLVLRFQKFAESLPNFNWHSKFDPKIMLETKLQAQGSLNINSKRHFQCGRHSRRLPYIRAPGRIAGE